MSRRFTTFRPPAPLRRLGTRLAAITPMPRVALGMVLAVLIQLGAQAHDPPRRGGPDFGKDPPRSYLSDLRTLWHVFVPSQR